MIVDHERHGDCEPVGLKEIAERLGVVAHTAHTWRVRGVFDLEPIGTVSGFDAFCWADVASWAVDTGRLESRSVS